jgi:hypothetical protein
LVQQLEEIKYQSESKMKCIDESNRPEKEKDSLRAEFESVRLSQGRMIERVIDDLQKRKKQKVFQIIFDNFKSINEADYKMLMQDVDQEFSKFLLTGFVIKVLKTERSVTHQTV